MPWWESNPGLSEIAKFSVIEELTITERELGRGSYGTVYVALHSGKPCAAKQLHSFSRYDKLEYFVAEINILSALKHPSIVEFLGVYFSDKTPILVMELMWKNLYSLLEEQPNQLFKLTKARILYDVACGLQYLHSQKKPVVHGNLHPSNILLNENLNAKIVDLGPSQPLAFFTLPSDIFYSAPETITKIPTYDTKSDVFSIGCTIIHLVTEKCTIPTDQFVILYENYIQKLAELGANRRTEYLTLMNDTPVIQHIAYPCLEDAPANRPTASGICEKLKKYILQLESEAPELAKQQNKDKFSLLTLLQSQEKQLESKAKLIEDLHKDKNTLTDFIAKKEKENELTICAMNQDIETLRQQLTDLNKNLTTTYKDQEDFLREDLKTKQEEIKAANGKKIQMQKEIDDLHDKLKNEKLILSQKIQLISDLENDMQKIKADAEDCKQERDQLFKANLDYGVTVKTLEQQIDQSRTKLEEKDKQIEIITAKKDNVIADLNEKQNEIEVSLKLAITYKNQVDQLREEIKTKQDKVEHFAIKNEALKLKLSESETEMINLKEQVRITQEELNKGTKKIEMLEQAISSSTNNEVHVCSYTY